MLRLTINAILVTTSDAERFVDAIMLLILTSASFILLEAVLNQTCINPFLIRVKWDDSKGCVGITALYIYPKR